MSSDFTSLATTGPTIEMPDRRIKGLFTLFLRLGMGIHLLNTGLLGYLIQMRNGPGMGMNAVFPGGGGITDPFQELTKVLPYLEIVVGVALIFGFLTTLAASAALVLIMLNPLLQTLYLLINPQQWMGGMGGMSGMGVMGRNGFTMSIDILMSNSSGTTQLLLGAIVLWLSPTQSNPYSIDMLIFQKRPLIDTDQSQVPPPPTYYQQPSAGTDSYVSPEIQEEIEVHPIEE